jgi:hypothetical protein
MNKNTGFAYERIYAHDPDWGGLAPRPPWEPPDIPAPARYDTCFSFVKRWRLPTNMGVLHFADCDRDGRPEVVGLWGSSMQFFERPEGDSLFQLQLTLPNRGLMDYGGDADGDGLMELMDSDVYGMTLREAPDSFDLPIDSVFAWPWYLGVPHIVPGGVTDIDRDGVREISFRPNYRDLYVLENIGDNSYALDYTVPRPESLVDNYSEYVAADFDGDGRNELVTIGSLGRVLCYEYAAPDSFVFAGWIPLPLWNAFWLVGPADLDADSILEFYAMCAGISQGGFFFYGFEATGDNTFSQFWADSLPGGALDDGNLGLADFDGDEVPELWVCSNAWLGVYAFRSDRARLGPVYLQRGVYGTPDAFDTDGNGRVEVFIGRPIPAGYEVFEFSYGSAYRGDINSDCLINGMDIAYFINYFKGWEGYDLPTDIYAADPNGNCRINGVDVLYLISFLKGGPPPVDRECPQ